MKFNDKEESFIFLDDRNRILMCSKQQYNKLFIKTNEITCILDYISDIGRDSDYERILDYIKEG